MKYPSLVVTGPVVAHRQPHVPPSRAADYYGNWIEPARVAAFTFFEGRNLVLDYWLAIVPEVYLDEVIDCALRVFDQHIKGRAGSLDAQREMLLEFGLRLLDEIVCTVEPSLFRRIHD